jgi:hypothetical protein
MVLEKDRGDGFRIRSLREQPTWKEQRQSGDRTYRSGYFQLYGLQHQASHN